MAAIHWEYALPIVGVAGLVRLIVYILRQRQDSGRIRWGIAEFVKSRDRVPPPPSFWKRFSTFYKRGLSSRQAAQYEFRVRYLSADSAIELLYFCPRLPLTITLMIESIKEPTVSAVSVDEGDGYCPAYFSNKVKSQGNVHTLTIWVYLSVPIRSAAISLEHTDEQFEYRADALLAVLPYPDYPILRDAYKYQKEGSVGAAMRYFEKYEQFTESNPWVCLAQSQYNVNRKEWSLAAHYALLATVNGQARSGCDFYGFARENLGFETTRESIDALLKREAEWSLDPQIGVLALSEATEFTCGLNGFHLTRRHQIFRVRRAAAARLLRNVSFEYNTSNCTPLHSALRIIRASGEIDKVAMENLIYADAATRNPAVTTEEERRALWMLPDLYAGDVVEWTSDILVRDHIIDEQPSPFEMTSLFSHDYPTLEGRIDVIARGNLELRFYQSHPQYVVASEVEPRDGERRYSFTGQKYVPARNLGFSYGELWLNPRVGFTRSGIDWRLFADWKRSTSIGKRVDEDRLPPEVHALYAEGDSVSLKLGVVFYWIRDTLKYGVFHRAQAMVGKPDRAQAIVKSGFADCKDRSYLLHLLCKELGVENEFYLTSAGLGSAIEELPADQFDHISLRAKVDGRWLYLDPTNSHCLFGSVPYWYQGMKALILDEHGTIVTLPEDEPQQNLLVIREVYDRIDDGWLAGSFFIRSKGQTARIFEEHWKSRSLSNDQRLVAAQQAIGSILDGAVLDRFDQLASTSDSDTFTVSGMCRRARCNNVGDNKVTVITWAMPVLPVEMWRGFQLGQLFGFHYPMSIEIDIEFTDSLAAALRDHSRIGGFRSTELEISEHCENRGDARAIHRTVNVNRKFIQGDSVAIELPRFCEGLEQALSLTCVFESRRE